MAELIILPARPQSHSRVFANRKAAGWAVVLMWLFLKMSPEQNRAGSRNGTRQRWVLGVPPAPSLPGSLATFQEIRQLNGKSSLFSLQSALHTWVFFNNKSIFSSPVVPIERGRCGPPAQTKTQFSSARHLCLGTGTSVLLGWGQVLPSSSQHLHPKILPSLLLRRTPDREQEELLNNLQP